MVTDDMVALVPQLHTFARSLCRDGVRADDLVQEALMRAINNIERFKPGTNLKAWLFTIVRNEHYSQLRRRKFEAHGMDTDAPAGAERPAGPRWQARIARPEPRALVAVTRSAHRADPGERQRLLVRGSGGDLRVRGGNDQEPRRPRARDPAGDAGRPAAAARGAARRGRRRGADDRRDFPLGARTRVDRGLPRAVA